MPKASIHAFPPRSRRSSTKQQRMPAAKQSESLLDSYKKQKGVYARVAKHLHVDPSYVSRVANGKRRSDKIKQALLFELGRGHSGNGKNLHCPICDDANVTAFAKKLAVPVVVSDKNTSRKRPMAAYRCTGEHIFMVSNADVQLPRVRAHAA